MQFLKHAVYGVMCTISVYNQWHQHRFLCLNYIASADIDDLCMNVRTTLTRWRHRARISVSYLGRESHHLHRVWQVRWSPNSPGRSGLEPSGIWSVRGASGTDCMKVDSLLLSTSWSRQHTRGMARRRRQSLIAVLLNGERLYDAFSSTADTLKTAFLPQPRRICSTVYFR